MSKELPENWTQLPLSGLLASLESGARPRGGVRGITEGIPSIGGEHLSSNGQFDFSSIKFVPKKFAAGMKKGRIHLNDILIVKDGATTGKVSLVTESFPYKEAYVNEHVFVCRHNEKIIPKFLFYFLYSQEGQRRILENFKGSAQGGINQSFAPNTEVPIAPPDEQKQIVAKLEKILTKLNQAKKRLETIPRILKRFRQSVLDAACSGRLTANWRKDNNSASDALALVAELEEKHKDAGGHKRGNAAPPTDEAHDLSSDDLPSTWGMTDLRTAVCPDRPITYGILKPGADVADGILYVRVADFPNDKLNLNTIRRTTKEIEKAFARARLRQGDILLSIRGTVGRVCVAPEELENANITQDTARLSIQPLMNSSFVVWFLRSFHTQQRMQKAVKGVAVRGINIGDVRALQLPIPPLAEQNEIVRRIENLFKLADSIEARYLKAEKQVEKLSQSVFAKAFRGELLTQAPAEISEGKASQWTKPILKTEALTDQSSDVVYFRSIVPRREERYVNCVPSLDLKIAAGAFGDDQKPNFNEWVEINTSRPLKKGMFVAKVVGRSMEPLIPDGAHCLFQFKAPQLRNDMIAVFQLHDSEDPESGGHYTVKRLRAYRQNTDEGVVRKAKLIPENPAFQPITVDEENVKFVAEFLEVLQPLAKAENRSVRGGHV